MKGRQRGRNGGKPRPHQPGGHRNHNFDANIGRMRGNAQQLMDKYLALARDASAQGDRVMAENYYQHADHYYRVINARFEGQQNNQRRFNGQPYDRPDRPFEGPEPQSGGFGDYHRVDIPPPVTSQSLGAQAAGHQPFAGQPAPNMAPTGDPMMHAQSLASNQPQPMAQPLPDQDIGLPPQLFGAQPAASPVAAEPPDDVAEPQQSFEPARTDGERGERPRFGGRRRRGPRTHQGATAQD